MEAVVQTIETEPDSGLLQNIEQTKTKIKYAAIIANCMHVHKLVYQNSQVAMIMNLRLLLHH